MVDGYLSECTYSCDILGSLPNCSIPKMSNTVYIERFGALSLHLLQ